jgi:hypothetical protein
MRVLDLFAGLRGWSDPWKARGHEVITLDNDPSFDSDLTMDIGEFAKDFDKHLDGWRPDVILASPPCEAFSVMTIGRNWTREHEPKTDKARLALELVGHTLYAIHWLRPTFWVIENPRAKLRKLEPMLWRERVTVTYCQYGEPFMKPTDLWGGFPPSWRPRPMCKPRSDCHISAARGSRTGIQGAAALTRSGNLTEHKRLQRLMYGVQDPTPEQQEAIDAILAMSEKPTTSRTKYKGGMIEVMSRFPSWSKERNLLSALRARIPEQLSTELCLAAEKDIAD